jgi:HAD superfamily hydrolase (TIGR01509 family)
MDEIKAVTFDVGGTLARGSLNKRAYGTRVVDYLRSRGFEVETRDWSRAISKALEELRVKREKLLELKFREFCSITLRALEIPDPEELVEDIRSIYFECFPQTERRGVRKTLAELSKSYALGAVSNSMSLLPKRFLEQSGLIKYFRVVVISGQVGYRKPHPEIFERALSKLGVEAGHAVHVGNSLEEDVAGARSAGMCSVFITPKTIEDAAIEPDLAVPSLQEVPWALEVLSNSELRGLKEVLGECCVLCAARQVCLYRVNGEGEYVLLCPECRLESLREPRLIRRKHGKYRAVYRRAWIEARRLQKP